MPPSGIVLNIKLFGFLTETFSLVIRGDSYCYKHKTSIQYSPLTDYSLSSMATLRIETKLAAVSRETPENTRNSKAQNTIDPELAEDYISQVSAEMEGRIAKKFSKEFSTTESRILAPLSKHSPHVPATFTNHIQISREAIVAIVASCRLRRTNIRHHIW